MNWLGTTWTLIAGMSLALGLVQFFVWFRRRSELQHLVFAAFAVAAAVGAVAEYRELSSPDLPGYAHAFRFVHLGFGTALLFLPWFVRTRFHAGNPWLLGIATALRLVVLLVAVSSAMIINLKVEQLHAVALPGGVAAPVPAGRFNPWVIPAHLNLLFLLAYFVDAIRELGRRGDVEEYRRGLRVCGSMIAFVLIAGGQTVLVTYGFIDMPFAVTPVFLLPILVLSYELGLDLFASRQVRDRLGLSESLLRESEERWELAAQIAGIAPWSWHAKTNELRLSPKAREMFGLDGDAEVSLEQWSALIHPEDAERIHRGIQASVAEGSSFERDYRALLPDGRVRWITTRGRIERDAEGRVLSMHGVSLDLTRVRQADAMFRAALESAPNAIFLVDGASRIKLANARASRLFGYDHEELDELPLGMLVPDWTYHPERRQRSGPPPGGVERRSGTRQVEGRRRGGEPVPLELALRPVEGGLMLASVVDITERLAAEQESALQRTELAHLSRVAVLGEMTSSFAHELNQPLTAIVSNSQAALRLLARGPEPQPDLRETLQDIAASGNRAGDVIRRLRAMLKKEEMQRQPLDVNQLISEVLQLYRSDLINRGVQVQLKLDHALPLVSGDRVQLQQVLLNLVINACDAMANLPGDRELCICSRAHSGEVEFAVCDIGPGIAPERLEQVFEPFITTKSAGMGLGLSVCKTIVKSHGGRIWAANREDVRGAAFHVVLGALVGQASTSPEAELDPS